MNTLALVAVSRDSLRTQLLYVMTHAALLPLLLLSLSLVSTLQAQTPKALSLDWQQQHITRVEPSLVRHADLKNYLQHLRDKKIVVKEVGRSVAGREIFQMEFGTGPLKIFMWSQMHGDEPTATSALIDLFYYLQQNRHTPWVAAIERNITLRAIPMLNPDGAELYQRRNLQFIDINRDARQLSTPEGRLLKKLRDEWSPAIGFNLHNQSALTSVGASGKQATISLLAVAYDRAGSVNAGRLRSKKICHVITESLTPFIDGHIGRYDDTFNPRAFGDMITLWGTPVVLIETGALKGKSEMDLVELNFVALASALSAIANGTVEKADPAVYDRLPYNTSGVIYSLMVRGATVVDRLHSEASRIVPPFAADIAVNEYNPRVGERRLSQSNVQDVGDLSDFYGLEEVSAAGYFVCAANGNLRPGANASLLFYRKDRVAQINWTIPDLETRFPPDATYRNGEWMGRDSSALRSRNSR